LTDDPIPNTEDRILSPNYKWAVVGMLWFICFFNYADRQAIFSIFPVLEKTYGINKEQQGIIAAAFTVVYALMAPFAGRVGDRYPRKLVIIAGLYIWSIITGFTALCSKVWHFVVVRGAEGLGETFYFPASMSLVSDYHAKPTRSRAMSFHQTSVYAGTVGGGWLAGWMAQKFFWQSSFIVLGIAGVILGVVLARFVREPARNEAERALTGQQVEDPEQVGMVEFLAEILRTPSVLLLIVAFFGANLVALLFLTWSPTFLGDKFKLSLAAAGLTGTFFIQVGSMVGAALGGSIADRWRTMKPGGRMLTQAVGAIAGAPFIFLFGRTTELTTVIVAMSLFGIFKGIYDANIWASLYDVIRPSCRGAAVGIMNMVGWLGGAIGAYSLGALVQRKVVTMSVGFSSAATIYLFVAAALVLAGLRFAPRDTAETQLVA
jgi:MFS family permease